MLKNFPNYIQSDATDCGPSCLRIVAKYFGKHYNLSSLRELTNKGKTGVSMLSISQAAESIGFRTQGIKLGFNQLKEVSFPCIAHWAQNHFVVVYKIKKNGVVCVSDPAIGLVEYSEEEFLRSWGATIESESLRGIILLLEPTPDFFKAKEELSSKASFGYLFLYLRPYRKLIIQLLLGFLVGSLLSLIFPFLTQAIVDVGISTNNLSFIVLVLVAQLTLVLSQTFVEFVRSWIMLHISVRISISIISDFLIKLMKLPINFFDIRMIGDLRQRIDDNYRIQNFLTGTLISMSFGIFMFIIYSFVMAYYDLQILLVFYVGSIVYVLWVLLFLKKRKILDYKRFSQSAANQSNVYQLITGMQEIKLNNCEQQKRWEWEIIQARLFKISIKSLILNQNQQIGSILINQIKNILISFIAAKSVIKGDMTLGMMMAVQYIIGQLNSPINQFISFVQQAQDTKISLERLGEIHVKEDEVSSLVDQVYDLPIKKDIVINNLSFSYDGSKTSNVLDNITLTIPENKVTAIVGVSGSGKTTLLKLLLRFYPLDSNVIQIGKLDFTRINVNTWRSECGTVMQDGFIFSDTIVNNIAIGVDKPDKEKLAFAVRMANIKEYIENLPLGYNTKIGQEGRGLSQGQKQRILIARAVYKDPSYLFLDEATNSLDAKNEKEILINLETFFKEKTVVVVAHRLSTVKNAHQVVVLDMGKIVEIGSHQELIKQRGSYYRLVKNQLELGG